MEEKRYREFRKPEVTYDYDMDESQNMGEEDTRNDDEFWTKHAEKINTRINGIMKKSMAN